MIWVVGSGGLLGTELMRLLASRGLPAVGTGREVDILDPAALRRFIAGKAVRWIVNCAGFTDVDAAEDHEELALRLNAEGPANLAKLCPQREYETPPSGSPECRSDGDPLASCPQLIHISTDYVFGGDYPVENPSVPARRIDDGAGGGSEAGIRPRATGPYRESDPVLPANAYGRSKAEGESRVLAAAPGSIILRTAWLYGEHGPNFVDTMLGLLCNGGEARVVADRLGNPTWTRDLAGVIADIVERPSFPAGVFHFSGEGETSWYSLALEILRVGIELGLVLDGSRIIPVSSDEYPSKARRPAYSGLSKEKIRALGIMPPEWKASLRAYLAEKSSCPGTIQA